MTSITPARAVVLVASGFTAGAAGALCCVMIVDAVVRHLGRTVDRHR